MLSQICANRLNAASSKLTLFSAVQTEKLKFFPEKLSTDNNLFLVNHGLLHWTLLFHSKNVWHHFDSFLSTKEYILPTVVQLSASFAPTSSLSINVIDCPSQKNSSDCGIFVIGYVLEILKIKELSSEALSVAAQTVNQEYVSKLRLQLQEQIKTEISKTSAVATKPTTTTTKHSKKQ